MSSRIERLFGRNAIPFASYFDEINPIFTNTLEVISGAGHPVSDVYTTRNGSNQAVLHFEFAVPGISPDDIEVSTDVINGTVKIKNHSSAGKDSESPDRKYCCKRISRRRFENTLHIPHGYEVDEESISLKHGILAITLKPSEEVRDSVKRLSIKT